MVNISKSMCVKGRDHLAARDLSKQSLIKQRVLIRALLYGPRLFKKGHGVIKH